MTAAHVKIACLIGARTVSPRNRILLMTIAVMANPRGQWETCYDEIEDLTGYKRSSVGGALLELEALGLLKRRTRKMGRGRSDRSVIQLSFVEYRNLWGDWEDKEIRRRRWKRLMGKPMAPWRDKPGLR